MKRRDVEDLVHYNIGVGDLQGKINELLDLDEENADDICEISMQSCDTLLDWIVDQMSLEEEREE